MILLIKDIVEKATEHLVTMCSTQLLVTSITACFHQYKKMYSTALILQKSVPKL